MMEHIAELEAVVQSAKRLEAALSMSVSKLPLPPRNLTGHSIWPPAEPEAQLAVLAASEASASCELKRTRAMLDVAQATICELQTQLNQQEQPQTFDEGADGGWECEDLVADTELCHTVSPRGSAPPPPDDESTNEELMLSSSAHRLCVWLGGSYTTDGDGEWEPERWTEELYELLQASDPMRSL